jgi:hypothetical protein
MAAGKDKLLAAALVVTVGLAFILTAIFRPSFLWEMGKVRQGREWLGDAGMAAVYGVFGAIVVGVGLFVVWRTKK